MIGASAFLLALSIGITATPVADYDIPYFQANPEVHAEVLRRCHRDFGLAASRECENAEAAGSRRMGQPLPPVLDVERKTPKSLPPQVPKAKPVLPVTKGKDRAA